MGKRFHQPAHNMAGTFISTGAASQVRTGCNLQVSCKENFQEQAAAAMAVSSLKCRTRHLLIS